MLKLKQQYHLEPNRGLLNDPNGLSWFNGKYYVFFQWNPFAKDHSYKEWGLFTSKDLLKWKFEGSAMIPDQIYDQNGVYSGSGYVIGNQLYLFYTGNNKKDGKRKSSQCLAVTGDGRQYQKKGVVLNTPEGYTEHFRDPKVFQGKDSVYDMVVGGQRTNGKGAIALCRSEDGENWNYQGMLASSEQYEMIECPDLFEMDGKTVLLFNPQKRDNAADTAISSFSAYKLVEFEEETGTLQDGNLDHGYKILDAGFDFYAPQTFLSQDGRRILFAWMSRMDDEQEKRFSKTEPNIHCLTIPRELVLRGEKLFQKPIRELYGLLGRKLPVGHKAASWTISLAQRTFFMRIQRNGKEQSLHVVFHQGEAEITYNPEEKQLSFYRKNWVGCTMEGKTASVKEWKEIEVWSDNSSMEIFVNGGQIVFSARIFPESGNPEITVEGDGMEMEIREIVSTNKEENVS